MNTFSDPVERLLYISLAVVLVCIFLTGIIVAIEIHDQNRISEDIKTEALLTRQHTDCVANLLAQPNRGTIRIQDLQNCKIGP